MLKVVEEKDASAGSKHLAEALYVRHAMLNKYRGPYDESYKTVSSCLENFARSAHTIVGMIKSSGSGFKAGWNVPFPRNQQFVRRHAQLDQLENTLFAENQPQILAVYGLGGIGKTQIALELAYRTREKDPECSIFWMPATNAESLQQAFSDIGQQLDVPGVAEKQANAKKLVQSHLSKDSAGKWLLIVDNVDDMEMWNDELKHYLPKSRQGCIFCTTRSRKIAVTITAAVNVIEVKEMDEMAATQLMKKSLLDQDLIARHEDTRKLLEQLTFLPLAIVQAAAYINENGISLLHYLSLLGEQEQVVVDLLSKDFEDEGRYKGGKNPVATTWLISFEQIRQLNPLAAEYLSFMSCVDPKDIPQSLLPPGLSRVEETDAIGTLSAYSFVSTQYADKIYDVHRLVHLATRNWLRREESLTMWVAKAMKRLAKVFPDGDHMDRSIWRSYLTHARCVLDSNDNKEETKDRGELIWKLGACLFQDGRYNEAEKLLLEEAETNKRVLGEEHPQTLTSMGNLASTYTNQGRWKEAEELEVQVLETKKRVLGEEHPETLISMGNLASTYRKQGRWKEAEELEVQVLETMKRVLEEEHPHTLISMGNLAATYMKQGRWKEAEELEVQVLETSKRVLGEEHPATLISMGNLAEMYNNQGRLKEAEELEVQVLETSKRVLGEEHPETLTSMGNLVSTYKKQGRWKEAEELGVQVLETRKRVLGEEHPETLTSMGNLVSTYKKQGRWKEAEELGVQVLETRKRMLGEKHPKTLISMGNLASTYMNQGRWKEAEELGVQVLETRKRVLGEEHPHTLTSMGNLAATYKKQGRLKEAEELEVLVLETRKRVIGEEHPGTLICMGNLAKTYKKQGRRKEAEELKLQRLEIRKRVLRE
jgi:tetratricopeptide (TPR) repeat protein